MFLNHADRAVVESLLQTRNVHPEEILRLTELAAVPETVAQELVLAVQQGQPAAWYVADIDDPAYLTTNIAHTPALELERRIVAGIGSAGTSQYTRLYVGGTDVDAPPDPDVVHVNCLTEDMRFPATGPRILTAGQCRCRTRSSTAARGITSPTTSPSLRPW
jgi:hypothetical protein